MPGRTNFEDVYSRAQIAFGVERMNQTDLVDWLTGGEIVTDKSLGVRILAQEMENQAIVELTPLIESAETPEEISRIEDIEIDDLQVEVAERKFAVAEGLADIIRTSTEVSEFEDAVEDLRKISPQKLGGLKTAEIMRGRRAFREMF